MAISVVFEMKPTWFASISEVKALMRNHDLSLVTWLVGKRIAPQVPSLLAASAEVSCRGSPRLQAKDNKRASRWFSFLPSVLDRRPHDLLFCEICSS